MEMTYKYGKRDYQGKMVDTVNVYLEGGVLIETALDELKAQHPGYTEVLMSSLVLFKPPEDIETELAEKNELISALGQTLRVVADALPDEQAVNFPNLYPSFDEMIGQELKVNFRISVGDALYRVVQAHTAQADWRPETTASLFARIMPPGDDIPDWAPGSWDEGVQVTHNGKTWISMVDNNTWEPGAAGIGDAIWKEAG